MSYEQFLQEIEKRLKNMAGEKKRICIRTAVKNNGKVKSGIAFTEPDVNISPTIYLEEYYERFLRGGSLETIAERIMELYQSVRLEHSWEGEFIQKFMNVKNRIVYRLINKEANQKRLLEVPHTCFLDLAIVYYVLIDIKRSEDRIAAMMIRNEHLEWWKVTEEEIHRLAHVNTEKLLPYEFSTMYDAIGGMLWSGETKGAKETKALQEEEDMYVLTNVQCNYGASALLYENRLKRIGDYINENYYVLPSSVHEVIIVPESKAPGHKELCGIVRDINETQVLEEEMLSNCAYFYQRDEGKLVQ